MPDKIGFGEAFEGDFLKKMQDLNKEFTQFLVTYKALIKESKDNKELIQAAKSLVDINKAAEKANKTITKLNGAEKEQARLRAATTKATNKAIQATTKQGVAHQKAILQQKAATAQARKLAGAQLGLTKTTGRLFKSIAKGNIIANAFSRIFRGIVRGVGNTIRKIADFDQAVADVGAIAQATDQEMEKLSRSALKLGGSTKFTATEVAQLQKELAKLGFTVSQIRDAQAAILSLAAAANTDLARAAEIAGITVNQFGLQASDTAKVVDVMARSFTTSALDIEKFAEAMKFVGPAAKASGISIERATALIGQLADAGISGSMAGTSLRQIMLALSKESGTFSEKIERAAKSGLTLAGASEQVQKRAATALLVLADGSGDIDAFTESLENAAGAADELARRQLDTLKGAVTQLASAWDRLLISVTNSESGFRGIKSILTGFSLLFNNYIDSTEALTDAIDDQAESFRDSFLQEIKDRDYAGSVNALGEEIKFIKREINEYGQVLSEANFQLANTKKREKEAREAFEQKIGTTEGMLRLYKEYLTLLQDIEIADEAEVIEEVTKETTAQAKARKLLNDAYAESQKLIAQIKAPEDLVFLEDEIANLLKAIGKESKDLGKEIELDEGFWDDFFGEFQFEPFGTRGEVQNYFEDILRLGEIFRKKQAQSDADASKENKIQTLSAAGDLLQEGFNIFSGFQEREIQAIDEKQEREILSVENKLKRNELSEKQAAENIEKIEKRSQKERAKILTKQAKSEKAAALISIAINTAVAAMMVAGQTGVGAVIAVPLIIALGAAQLAAVLAQPIPKFAKGTMSSPEGPAITGEKGSELKIDPSGKVSLTPPKPTLDYLKKGTKIVPADVTQQFLRYATIANSLEGQGDDNTIMMLMGKLDEVKRAIKNKPAASSTITPAGILTATHRGNTTIKEIKRFIT